MVVREEPSWVVLELSKSETRSRSSVNTGGGEESRCEGTLDTSLGSSNVLVVLAKTKVVSELLEEVSILDFRWILEGDSRRTVESLGSLMSVGSSLGRGEVLSLETLGEDLVAQDVLVDVDL